MSTLPDKELYAYRSMTPNVKKKFESWYAENHDSGFHLAESLASYCINDVSLVFENN